MADAALQRKNMVESQVRPSDVTDRRIMAAMQALPREKFVPGPLAPLAYMDEVLPFAGGRGLMAPRAFARLIQLARVGEADKVLDLGVLGGYSAAVLSQLAGHVVGVECDAELADSARARLRELGITNVEVVTGDLSAGHKASAPYDVIIAEGAIEQSPEELLTQMKPSGRFIAVEIDEAGVGRAVTIQRAGAAFARRTAFDISAPRLPGFARPAAFKF